MKRTVNGESRTRFYSIWKGIKGRCYNGKTHHYELYGGRGIKCSWNTYFEFKRDMYESYLKHCSEFGEKETTIDRIDSNKDYCKENCKRATYKEQNNHLRNQKRYNRKGKLLLLKEIYEIESIPVSYLVFKNRVCEYGWTLEQAITVPKNKRP